MNAGTPQQQAAMDAHQRRLQAHRVEQARQQALAQREAQRARQHAVTRDLPAAARAALAALLELCRQQRFETLPSPLAAPRERGEWTDLEPLFADLAEQLAALTPMGDLWRVLSLLALEAAGSAVDLGPGMRQAACEFGTDLKDGSYDEE